ncbi:hypothetical protein HK100_009982, partial [Physocladia obscura]
MAASHQALTNHMRQVITAYQNEFALSPQGRALKKKQPATFAARLKDSDAIAAAAKVSSFHDLRRLANKPLRNIIAAMLASNEVFFLDNDSSQSNNNNLNNNGNRKDNHIGNGNTSDSLSHSDSDNEEIDEDAFNKTLTKFSKSKLPANKSRKQSHDLSDSDSIDADDSNPDIKLMTVKGLNSMNRHLLGVYAKSNAASAISPVLLSAPQIIETGQSKQTPSNSEQTDISKESKVDAQERIQKMRTANANSSNKRRKYNDSKNSESSLEKYAPPKTKLDDLGGIDSCIEDVLQLIGMPLVWGKRFSTAWCLMKHPEVYLHLGIQPPRGVLLHGPPGCGKSMLANAIAGESQVPFIQISAPSIVSGMSGESEKKIREIFDDAKQHAPCILFIDEIDAITPKRETAQREMERRIVAQLLTCMD